MNIDLKKNFIIIGTSSHGQVAFDIAAQQNKHKFIGWVDSNEKKRKILGHGVLGKISEIKSLSKKYNFKRIFIAISNNYERFKIWEKISLVNKDIKMISIISPNSFVSNNSVIKDGSLIMPGAIINNGAKIGLGCIVNTNSSLDHDGTMKDFSSLLPGCITGGNVKIGKLSCICLGSKILHKISIGDNCYVGANSLVLKSIPSNSLAYGIPAKIIKKRKIYEKHF
jgi:sugar O-acyltransferase (sialic acid O-acetyltransferase NeuD family)